MGGLAAAILIAPFPSSLQWVGQNHKGAFAIAGALLVSSAWRRALSLPSRRQRARVVVLGQLAVPVVAVTTLRVLGPALGVRAAICGMLGGMLVARRRSRQLQDDTCFLRVVGAWVSVVCALAVHALADRSR